MSIISKTAKKTDKVDAEKIAQVLRMDMIPECYVPDRKVRGVRDMIRQRIKMVRNRTQVINRTHSMLDAYDIRPAGTTMYGKKTLAQLEGTTLADRQDDYILKQHARQIRYLTGEIEDISTRLESIACGNRYARLPTSMTGVGAYSALLPASEIDDVSRFARPKHIVSMAGLCPGVSQSGGAPRMTRIKKLGTNRLVNWVMCEAANVAIQHDPRMAAVYEAARRRHAGRHGPAIIVVAHKMITIIWHMLHTMTPYESRNESLYKSKLVLLQIRVLPVIYDIKAGPPLDFYNSRSHATPKTGSGLSGVRLAARLCGILHAGRTAPHYSSSGCGRRGVLDERAPYDCPLRRDPGGICRSYAAQPHAGPDKIIVDRIRRDMCGFRPAEPADAPRMIPYRAVESFAGVVVGVLVFDVALGKMYRLRRPAPVECLLERL